jgi:hypothetical protein
VGGFTIYFVLQGSLRFAVGVNIQEWKVVFFFFVYCNMFLVVEFIEVV